MIARDSLPLTVIVLTLNEERHLPGCLESVRDLGRQLLVVDSGSTDRTVEIARAAGAEVVTRRFV
ncbi:MAG: glycosyltransferase, partial [Thermomicrobium sp.]